jgi:F-type H+-transporting ATPase subunit epsilon
MADTIALEIVTPDGVKLSEQVSELTAPSVNGEFGVLPGHRSMLAALTTGIVSYIQAGEKHEVAIGAGFAEVSDDHALLLTDRFIRKPDIDPVLVRKDLKELDEALDKFEGDFKGPEYGDLISRELWAAAQLDLYGDPPAPRMRTLSEFMFDQRESYVELARQREEAAAAAASEEQPN